MAVIYKFRCKKCNKEVQGITGNRFALFSGVSVQFRCRCCRTVQRFPVTDKYPGMSEEFVAFPSGKFFPSDDGIEMFIHDTMESGKCRECGEVALEPWAYSTDGCPECGGELVKLDVPALCVD